MNREVAFAHVREAVRLGRGGEAPSRQLEILREGSRFARPWQLLAATADVSAEIKGPDGRPNYQQVARAYLDALDVGNNRNLTPAPPPKAVTARLLNRVHEMRALAKTFVPAGEVLTRAAGGVEVDVIPVPMKFHYKHPLPEKSNPDASDMTEEGRQYAIEAIGILKSLQNPRIRLVGHTDPIGGTAYNRALGQRRANAVRNFMVAQGYDPQFISIKSLGQERPIAIESTGLEDAERFEILRRVEICFVDKPNLSEACQ
ncbi:MAG: OmpA family protein [Hyphomicrobium sp.]